MRSERFKLIGAVLILASTAWGTNIEYTWIGTVDQSHNPTGPFEAASVGDPFTIQMAMDGEALPQNDYGYETHYFDNVLSCYIQIDQDEYSCSGRIGIVIVTNNQEIDNPPGSYLDCFYMKASILSDIGSIPIWDFVECYMWSIEQTPPDCITSTELPRFLDYDCFNLVDPSGTMMSMYLNYGGDTWIRGQLESFSIEETQAPINHSTWSAVKSIY